MEKEILIILVKSGICGYCINFKPIYKISENIYKSNDFLNKYDIKFEDYDMDNNDIKNIFIINHNDIKDKIKWYPTIFINIRDGNNAINSYLPIEHTIINHEINEKNQEKEAAKRFLENIVNGIKTLESDSNTLYIQQGGLNILNDEMYKKKYLKYKSKYYELKNKLN